MLVMAMTLRMNITAMMNTLQIHTTAMSMTMAMQRLRKQTRAVKLSYSTTTTIAAMNLIAKARVQLKNTRYQLMPQPKFKTSTANAATSMKSAKGKHVEAI
jgi:hypothetical protein